MGSVKDLKIIRTPSEDTPGIGRFVFSDRYSVFDWGEMPDLIPDKGKAICLVTCHFFEVVERLGIRTHYIGIVEDERVKKLCELTEPTNVMEFKMVRVIKPKFDGINYDYSPFKYLKSNFLIPLEVIYRNSIPEGSSLLKRLRCGEIAPEDVGLKGIPEPNTRLERPILDFSTKLEITDRYLKEDEAYNISGLSEGEFMELKRVALRLNELISEKAGILGLYNEDGKFEFGLDENRNLMLVDAIGALDECRFTYEGIPFSKEVLRIYYRSTRWYSEIENAKKEDRQNWKKLVGENPPPLPPEWKQLISDMYKSYANEITGRRFFDTKPINEVLVELKNLIQFFKN